MVLFWPKTAYAHITPTSSPTFGSRLLSPSFLSLLSGSPLLRRCLSKALENKSSGTLRAEFTRVDMTRPCA